MEAVWMAVGGLVGMTGGVFVGLKWGESLREKHQGFYWLANLAVMLSGVALVFAGSVAGWAGLAVAGIGLMGGGVSGLKYGLGKTVGAWKTVDRITGSDELPRG